MLLEGAPSKKEPEATRLRVSCDSCFSAPHTDPGHGPVNVATER